MIQRKNETLITSFKTKNKKRRTNFKNLCFIFFKITLFVNKKNLPLRSLRGATVQTVAEIIPIEPEQVMLLREIF